MWTTAKQFYNSSEWKRFRQLYILDAATNGIVCTMCDKNITESSDIILHHSPVELNLQNLNDYNVSLNPDNVKVVCFNCHNAEHERFGKGNKYLKKRHNGVYIVYGAPMNPLNSGGITYPSSEGLYCYKDFDDMKLRVICLDALDFTLSTGGGAIDNPSTFGFKIPQLNWLANEALDLADKNGYSVIVLCHIPPTEELMYFDPSSAVPIRNSELLIGILNAFKAGGTYSGDTTGDNPDGGAISVTFAGAGNLIAYIHGHIHADNMHVPSGINFQVVSLNSGWAKQRTDTLPEGATSPVRVPDTLSGICVPRTWFAHLHYSFRVHFYYICFFVLCLLS